MVFESEARSDPLLTIVIRYCSLDPVGGASALEMLSEVQTIEVLEGLSAASLEKLLIQLSPSFISNLVSTVAAERVVPVLEKGGAEVFSSVLLSLPEDGRGTFLQSLPKELRDQIEEFLSFPESSVGRSMKTDYSAFHGNLTVQESVAKLKIRSGVRRAPSNVFVIDDHRKLVGVIPMRDLIGAQDATPLRDIMHTNVISAAPFDDASSALHTLSGRGFTSLPVVDSEGHLLGVVRATDLLSGAQEIAGKDIQKLFGVGKDERSFSPILFCLKKRLPWLHVNLGTAFLAATVVALFEDIISKITVLAVYLPVVAGQGGNAGAQSLAVVMRGLIMREIPPQHVKRLLIKESLIGMVNGVVIGIVTAIIAWLWNGNPYLGLVIGLAMIVNLVIAGFAGAAIPTLMKRLGLDPAQSSSIVLTTVTDVVGFFAFLGFAVLFQDMLMG